MHQTISSPKQPWIMSNHNTLLSWGSKSYKSGCSGWNDRRWQGVPMHMQVSLELACLHKYSILGIRLSVPMHFCKTSRPVREMIDRQGIVCCTTAECIPCPLCFSHRHTLHKANVLTLKYWYNNYISHETVARFPMPSSSCILSSQTSRRMYP